MPEKYTLRLKVVKEMLTEFPELRDEVRKWLQDTEPQRDRQRLIIARRKKPFSH